MAAKLPKDQGDLDLFVTSILNDTGAFARNVLGMDTDRDQYGNATSAIGKGGIRSWGPHQEMIEFMDDWQSSQLKHLMAPRFSFKSSAAVALVCRCILNFPNIAIFYCMANKALANQRAAEIVKIFETNEIIKELFGNVVASKKGGQMISTLRNDRTLMTPTLSVGSIQSIPTGIRPNLIIFDDLVDDVNSRTEGGLKRGIETIKACLFLRAKNGVVLNIATPRHDQDANAWILDQDGWAKLTHLDVGFNVIRDDFGRVNLEGEARWEHLTKDFLMSQLNGGIDFFDFMTQYKLRVVSSIHAPFKRNQFQPFAWKPEHKDLTGYLLTDVATGMHNDASLSVLLYIGLDHKDRLHILDCECGHWQMQDFCRRFMDMRARWSAKVNHQAELIEQNFATPGYMSFLGMVAKERGVRCNIIKLVRNQAEKSKDQRVMGMQARFQSREVFVCNTTMPRTWQSLSQEKLMWDPEGFVDPIGMTKLPAGELVDQHIRYGFHPKKDIPDALACIDTIDKANGQRVCFFRKPVDKESEYRDIRPTVPSQGTSHGGYMSRLYDKANRRLRG